LFIVIYNCAWTTGPDLNPIGPCSLKNVGDPPSHIFSDINVQKHSVDTCEPYAILLLLSEYWEWRHGFLHSKAGVRQSLACWGPLFVGAPVRPNMLNMP